MNTTQDEKFDYQNHMREQPPPADEIQRGPSARHTRRDAVTKDRITIRIDADVIEQFKQMAPDGQGYQSLINRALREWLAAQDIKQLVREEFKAMTAEVVACIHEHSHS
jgi:uncharacterized protein (DUF4415 family)